EATKVAVLDIIKNQKFKMDEAISMRYLIADLPKYEGTHIAEMELAIKDYVKDGTLIRKGDAFYLSDDGFKKVYE
ncbi:MAG: hypothetical protein KAR06_06390, partial [Deltaproteobacteria bacterium]|nr:hypothetical protein [Deltaproteobacteria bacterium]